jgi:alginate O-acetyltransferase complex protein AlgI
MLVSTAPFFVFLAAVCLVCWLTQRWPRVRLLALVVANLFFLAKFSLIYLALPVATSFDFLIGLAIGATPASSSSEKMTRRILLSASVVLNLALMGSLKAMPLMVASGAMKSLAWLLPLSLSFYCFQSLTYTIDIYRGETEPTRDWLSYMGVGLLFPVMTAGPIPRTGKLLKQLAARVQLTDAVAGRALLLIAVGLVKKLLIADYIANNLVNRVFDTPTLYSSVEILVGVYGYALQLFFDFSGYTDIAIAAGLLLGFELPENFRRPYLSVNVAEFWRRWHISFSEWLRDYLFDVLPKRRKWPVLSYGYAFLITMALGGLWHGLSWTFLIWGVMHGLALGVVFAWTQWKVKRWGRNAAVSWWGRVLGWVLTFNYVCLAWVFFRATSVGNALEILRGIGDWTFAVGNLTPVLLGVLVVAAVAHSLPVKGFDVAAGWAGRAPFWAQGLAMAALVLLIETLAGRGSAPFVYGNF